MDLEFLFAVLLILIPVTVIAWIATIGLEKSPPFWIAPLILIILVAGIVLVNNQRQDAQKEEFGPVITGFLSEVEAAQASYFQENDEYSADLEELGVAPPTYDGGVLQTSETVEPTLSLQGKTEYLINGVIRAEEYELVVVGPPAQAELTRTCAASSEGGCEEGTWQP